VDSRLRQRDGSYLHGRNERIQSTDARGRFDGLRQRYVHAFHFCSLAVTCLNVANSRHFMFSGDPAKLAVTFANVDRF